MTWPELAGLAGSAITRVLILLLLNAPCSVAGRTGLYFMCVTYGKVPNALCVCLWYIATHVVRELGSSCSSQYSSVSFYLIFIYLLEYLNTI